MIVGLEGGMGNQMFQLAFGKSVAKRRNEPVYFTKWRLDNDPNGRKYDLDAFRCEVNFTLEEVPPIIRDVWYFNEGVWTNGNSFVGHWQSEKYFDDALVRSELALRELPSALSWQMSNEILKQPSCMIHVRRTDYLSEACLACHGNVSLEYYARAIGYVRSNVPGVRFFVFSDDPEWCHMNFRDCTVVGFNQSNAAEDIWLMSLCDHAIITNSTFGWWGAWLSDTKPRIVIGPQRWFVIGQNSSDVIPERWLKFANE